MRCKGYLILVRHGESRWNLTNRFTGWVDVPLSEKGIKEAITASKKLKDINIDICFTSTLVRAQETLLLLLAKQNYTGIFMHKSKKRHAWAKHKLLKKEIPIYSHNALNERYYGKLQGMNKDKARKEFGKEKVHLWRRSYNIRPPGGESLKDTYKRSVPYFKSHIMPSLAQGKNILLVAHGNSMRAIIKHLDNISDQDIPELNLPTGKLIVYRCIKGKLERQKHIHTFDRPICWHKTCLGK
jgi:2,3-bisphosphoglycerate-dependent phosphoglycerate mutase